MWTWYFCIFGLEDCAYADGHYVVKLSFPKDYPYKPPGIQMITPNGRFVERQSICTSFSDYHPELWDPSWNVQTIILGLISFMVGTEMTAGSMEMSSPERMILAEKSLTWNLEKFQQFEKLFGDFFSQIGIDPNTK